VGGQDTKRSSEPFFLFFFPFSSLRTFARRTCNRHSGLSFFFKVGAGVLLPLFSSCVRRSRRGLSFFSLPFHRGLDGTYHLLFPPPFFFLLPPSLCKGFFSFLFFFFSLTALMKEELTGRSFFFFPPFSVSLLSAAYCPVFFPFFFFFGLHEGE